METERHEKAVHSVPRDSLERHGGSSIKSGPPDTAHIDYPFLGYLATPIMYQTGCLTFLWQTSLALPFSSMLFLPFPSASDFPFESIQNYS